MFLTAGGLCKILKKGRRVYLARSAKNVVLFYWATSL